MIVADPNFAPMYATRTRKVKTDRRDARALAEACLLGAYRPAHRLSDPQRHVRGRLVVRDALVRTRTHYISIIRAQLRQHGYRIPSGSAEHFVHRVQSLPLPDRLRSVVAPLIGLMRPSTGSSRTRTPRSNTSMMRALVSRRFDGWVSANVAYRTLETWTIRPIPNER